MSRVLDEHVNVLCRDHLRRTRSVDGDVYGQETGLLPQLAQAVASSTEAPRAPGGTRANAPLDLGALDLLREVEATVNEYWPHRGDPGMVRVPVWNKLNAWAANTTDPTETVWLTEQCAHWVGRIRNHLEPPVKVTLHGACPACDHTHVVSFDDEGQAVHNPALVAYTTHATCQVCGEEWWGENVHELAHQLTNA